MSDSVAIILTTFNPDLVMLRDNISTYICQVGRVVVCDNSDDQDIALAIESFCHDRNKLIYLSMHGNKGIAYAQNRGVEYAISEDFELFIEIDQDSSLPSGYVEKILSSYYLLIDNNIAVGGLSPIAKSKLQNFIYHEHKSGSGMTFVDKTLSSGFLYNKSAYHLVGGKDESLFIDYVDWDWCWRANKLGLKVAVDSSLEIEHMLGDGHSKLFGFYVGLPSPIRLYYQYRNAFYIMQKDYVPIKWKVKRIFILIFKVPFYVFFADRKIERLKYILKGFLGFIRKEKGKISGKI